MFYAITYFHRARGRAVTRKFKSLESAKAAAQSIFAATGLVVGIERA
jgi:hypothetical protein